MSFFGFGKKKKSDKPVTEEKKLFAQELIIPASQINDFIDFNSYFRIFKISHIADEYRVTPLHLTDGYPILGVGAPHILVTFLKKEGGYMLQNKPTIVYSTRWNDVREGNPEAIEKERIKFSGVYGRWLQAGESFNDRLYNEIAKELRAKGLKVEKNLEDESGKRTDVKMDKGGGLETIANIVSDQHGRPKIAVTFVEKGENPDLGYVTKNYDEIFRRVATENFAQPDPVKKESN